MKGTLRITLVTAVAAVAALAGQGEARASTLAALALDSQALTVRGGDGYVVVTGQAVVLGRAGNALLILTETEGACEDVSVFGAQWRAVTTERRIYRGRDLRFRVVTGGCRVELAGRGLEVSGVVQGFASLKGRSGLLKINGGAWQRLPEAWATYRLGTDPAERARPTMRELLRLEIRWLRAIGMSWARVKQTAAWARFAALG